MESIRESIQKYIKTATVLFLVIAVGLAGCDDDNNSVGPDSDSGSDEVSNIAEVAGEDSSLSTFSGIVAEAGLQADLGSEESYTLFAPVDSAFDHLPEGFMDNLTEDQLNEVVNYHILSGALYTGDIQEESSLETVAGGTVFVKADNEIELNRAATVVEGDKEASNGVIHKIDQVLVPDSYLTVFGIIEKRYNLTKFACHCTSGRTNLVEDLVDEGREFTVFAPSDEAFENFEKDVDDLSDADLEHIMRYHVVEQKILSDQFTDGETLKTLNDENIRISVASDGTVSINGEQAVVQEVDLEGKNGVVYIIDSVVDPHADHAESDH